MNWNKFILKNMSKEFHDTNNANFYNFIERLQKINGNINNVIESIITIDLNNTDNGCSFMELETPNLSTIESTYMALNIRNVNLINSFIYLQKYIVSDINIDSVSKLGNYILYIADTEGKISPLVFKMIPQITVVVMNGSTEVPITTVDTISILPTADVIIKIKIGLISTQIIIKSFSASLTPYTNIFNYFETDAQNKLITQPLLASLKSICFSVTKIINQITSYAEHK